MDAMGVHFNAQTVARADSSNGNTPECEWCEVQDDCDTAETALSG